MDSRRAAALCSSRESAAATIAYPPLAPEVLTASMPFWYLSTMRSRAPAPIRFHRTKYGPELLVDVEWIHDIPTFLLDVPHQLGFHDLTLVTRGCGRLWLDQHAHAVAPGMILCTSPGQVRRWEIETPLDGICLFFPAEFLELFFNDPMFVHRLPFFGETGRQASMAADPVQRRRLRRSLEAMRAELRLLRPDSSHLLRARLYEFLVTMARLHAAQHPGARREPERVTARYRELVAHRARREHRVAAFARELAVSPNHLNALCQRHLGMSAHAVISERLALEGRRLLAFSDESVARIALSLGFRDASYFSRFMRRMAGESPRGLRRAVNAPTAPR